MSQILRELEAFSRIRPTQLKELREKGFKIVGSTGSYIPEELIYAAGAVPQRLCRGGEPEPLDATLSYIPRFVSPFIRAQFGYHITGVDPIYQLLDTLVAQCNSAHMAKLADLFELYTNLSVVRIGVPADWDRDLTRQYYLKKLRKLKREMENLVDKQIANKELREYIGYYNEARRLLKKISLMRKNSSPLIGGYDFLRLNHYSFYCGIKTLIEKLKSLCEELEKGEQSRPEEAPRILFAGHVVAVGDYTVSRMIEDRGGAIVVEHFDEGMRHYWWNVETGGNLLESLMHKYFRDRVPSSVQQPSWRLRLRFLEDLIDDFDVNGVIWYQLLYDEIYDMESYVLSRRLREKGIPMLTLTSTYEYSREETGPLATRIESFIETIRSR